MRRQCAVLAGSGLGQKCRRYRASSGGTTASTVKSNALMKLSELSRLQCTAETQKPARGGAARRSDCWNIEHTMRARLNPMSPLSLRTRRNYGQEHSADDSHRDVLPPVTRRGRVLIWELRSGPNLQTHASLPACQTYLIRFQALSLRTGRTKRKQVTFPR